MSSEQLLGAVRAVVVHELEGLDLSSLVLRLDDGAADRSVFVVARLGDGSVMVARVFEELQLQPVYLLSEDVEALVEALSSRSTL